MSIASNSGMDDILDSEEVGWPFPEQQDLDNWNYIECGEVCGDAGEDGYWYNQIGLFSWYSWTVFTEYCAVATTHCADVYDYENYDGWTLGLDIYTDNLGVLISEDSDFIGIAFNNYGTVIGTYIKDISGIGLSTTTGLFDID